MGQWKEKKVGRIKNKKLCQQGYKVKYTRALANKSVEKEEEEAEKSLKANEGDLCL